MRRLIPKLFTLAVAATLVVDASAFSLMGPFASWQTAAIGYNLPGDVGGPMTLSEDYRITVPVLNYGFDGTFLSFFGANGVAAVNAALPPYERIKRWAWVAPMTVEDGQLTPTLKPKRRVIAERHAASVEGMYVGGAGTG